MEIGGDDRAKARQLIHDLRNALGLVINYSLLVANELEDRPDLLDDLAEIGAAGRQAADLVQELSALVSPADS